MDGHRARGATSPRLQSLFEKGFLRRSWKKPFLEKGLAEKLHHTPSLKPYADADVQTTNALGSGPSKRKR
jgi:hypothetical protein